jgi:SAM-dependent methyltransferase
MNDSTAKSKRWCSTPEVSSRLRLVPDAVGRRPQYETFTDEFLEHARDGFFNAHYDRPACLSLLGDVAGRVVLDAACGPGLYAAELNSRGARVIGFDQSPRMVELCRAACP